METGSYVWCSADPKGDEAWILAELLKKGDTEIELQQVDRKEHVFTRPLAAQEDEIGERKFQGVELANAPLSEQERAEVRDYDLITLPHLHESAILHSLSERFMQGKIFTCPRKVDRLDVAGGLPQVCQSLGTKNPQAN
jgi:myosin heavy subunit